MTPARGTPILSSAAIRGITPHEQKGDKPPSIAAKTIIARGDPTKARAIKLSALLTPAYAANPIDKSKDGAVPISASSVNQPLARPCERLKTFKTNKIVAVVNQTLCAAQI
ncbi:MAG: hypothetical protein ACJA0Z_000943 [Halioglobus sp.]|jgi:hypothetical protein